jgi:MFS family permease
MLTKTFGFTPYQLGVIGTLFWVAIAISQIPAGKLADRYGRKSALAFSGVMFILLCLGWLFSTRFEMFAILHFLAGVSVSSWGPASSALLADSVTVEKRAEAMGRFTCFTGLVSSPASYISGNLYELFGFRGPIVATLILKVVILLIIFLFVQEKRRHTRT